MDVSPFLDYLKRAEWYKEQIVHIEQIPPRQASNGEFADPPSRCASEIHTGQGTLAPVQPLGGGDKRPQSRKKT